MKYSSLILLFLFASTLSYDVKEIKVSEKDEKVKFEDSTAYIVTELPDSGTIHFTLKIDQGSKISTKDFSYRLQAEKPKDMEGDGNFIEIEAIEHTLDYPLKSYEIVYIVTNDKKYGVIRIKNVEKGELAYIQVNYKNVMTTVLYVVAFLAVLFIVIAIVVCLCKNFCRCCAN